MKEKQQNVDFDSLFDDIEIVDESLPKNTKQSEAKMKGKRKAQAGAQPAPTSSGRTRKATKLSVEDRKTKFDSIAEFVKTRTARNLTQTRSAVRDSAWSQMLQLATSKEQLKQIVELMPGWKEASGGPNESNGYTGHCHELGCPLLALQAFGDYARYNLNLTLPAARQLLYSLHTQPIDKLMTASALFGLYSLPAAAQDCISCAISTHASDTAPTTRIGLRTFFSFRLHLRQLQATTTIDTGDKNHRENVWVQKAMENVEKTLKQRRS